ncbi:MAG TPA: hypothetical protein VLF15_12035, partial [Pseudoxanthomonas sp.]|nr:hypothetical protein [Pseudoxanthomonas sp.]
ALSLLAGLDRQIQPAAGSRALAPRKKLALTFCLRQQASLERTASIFIVAIGDPGMGELYQRMRKSLAAVQKGKGNRGLAPRFHRPATCKQSCLRHPLQNRRHSSIDCRRSPRQSRCSGSDEERNAAATVAPPGMERSSNAMPIL